MRSKCSLWILLAVVLLNTAAKAEPTPNKVVVLGTKHNGNKYLTTQTLFRAIQKIKPDIILLEFDSVSVVDCDIRKVSGAKLAEFLGIWNNPIEYRTARKYKESYPEVCLAPFDMYIPNRKEYVAYQRMMEKTHQEKLTQLYSNNRLEPTDSMQYAEYAAVNGAFLQKLDSSLEVMNRETLMDTIYRINQIENSFIRSITERYNDLQPYSRWYQNSMEMWEQRNNSMCEKIKMALNANSDRTILILTGLLHKPYLTNYLRKKEFRKLCRLVPANEALAGRMPVLSLF